MASRSFASEAEALAEATTLRNAYVTADGRGPFPRDPVGVSQGLYGGEYVHRFTRWADLPARVKSAVPPRRDPFRPRVVDGQWVVEDLSAVRKMEVTRG